MTLINVGGAVSPKPYQGGVGGNDPSVNGNDAPALSLHGNIAVCKKSDRVAPPAPPSMTLNQVRPGAVRSTASASPSSSGLTDAPGEDNERTLARYKREWAAQRLRELRWHVDHHPSERWTAKLEEAELWAKAVGL